MMSFQLCNRRVCLLDLIGLHNYKLVSRIVILMAVHFESWAVKISVNTSCPFAADLEYSPFRSRGGSILDCLHWLLIESHSCQSI